MKGGVRDAHLAVLGIICSVGVSMADAPNSLVQLGQNRETKS